MEYDRSYMGIDPGKDGAIVIIFLKRGRVVGFERSLPPLAGIRVDYYALFQLLMEWKEKYDPIHCVIEDVHSLFVSSKKANFEFGRVVGAEEALIAASGIPYTSIAPKKWQEEMWQGVPKVKKPGKTQTDTKKTSYHACRKLFPSFDLTKSERASIPHDGIIDGLLMAEYAKRKF